MKSFANLFLAVLAVCLVSGCYNAEEFTSQKPVDFVYINNSDYKIDALLLKSRSVTTDYDSLINVTNINLKPGERMTVVTEDPVDGRFAIFYQYVVIFNDSEFYCCFAKNRVDLNPGYVNFGWNENIPMYPSSYKVLRGTRENGHTVYEFTFTNAHYDIVRDKYFMDASDIVLTDDQGVRYFKGWDRYDDGLNVGAGVTIDGLLWSPFDCFSGKESTAHRGYDEALTLCPIGWRLPTAEEFKSLSSNHSKWGEVRDSDGDASSSAEGIWFCGTNEYSQEAPSIHLRPSDRWSTLGHKVGKYWSSTKVSDEEAVTFTFDDKGEVGLASESVTKNCLVRCVKDDRKKYYW